MPPEIALAAILRVCKLGPATELCWGPAGEDGAREENARSGEMAYSRRAEKDEEDSDVGMRKAEPGSVTVDHRSPKKGKEKMKELVPIRSAKRLPDRPFVTP